MRRFLYAQKCSGTLEMTCYERNGEKFWKPDSNTFYIQGGSYYEKKIVCSIYDRGAGIIAGNRMRFWQQ